MSDPVDMTNFNNFEPADDNPQGQFKSFDFNIGTCTGGKLRQNEQYGDQLVFNIRVTESIPANLYRTVFLQYNTAPRLEEKVGAGWVKMTDPAKIQAATTEWAKGMVSIIKALGLDASIIPEQLKDAEFANAWAAKAEGAAVVFGADDRGETGFPKVKAFMRQADQRMVVVLRRQDDPAKNEKGEHIPGLTALDQARQRIAGYKGK